jgi:hypothetical protein
MIPVAFVTYVTVGFIAGAYAMTIPGFEPAVYQTLSAIRKTTSDVFAQMAKAASPSPSKANKKAKPSAEPEEDLDEDDKDQ